MSWRAAMIGLIRLTLALAAIVLIAAALAQAAEQVDLLLVLSSDVSRSVHHPKFLLQREGYAAAISDPQVMDAIKSGPHQRTIHAAGGVMAMRLQEVSRDAAD